MMTTAPELFLSIDDARWSKKKIAPKKLCEKVLNIAWKNIRPKNSPPVFVNITFTNDSVIKKINSKTRGKNKTTNVLSFQNFETLAKLPKTKMPENLGDIVLALETIEKEAKFEKKTFKNHTTHLILHGFLHLCGYDHMNDKDAKEMESLEIKLLKKLDIPNPYEFF